MWLNINTVFSLNILVKTSAQNDEARKISSATHVVTVNSTLIMIPLYNNLQMCLILDKNMKQLRDDEIWN